MEGLQEQYDYIYHEWEMACEREAATSELLKSSRNAWTSLNRMAQASFRENRELNKRLDYSGQRLDMMMQVVDVLVNMKE